MRGDHMNQVQRRLLAGLASLALVGSVVVSTAGPAQAALTCPGAQVAVSNVYHDVALMGRLGIYRDGPHFCGVMVKAGWSYGARTWVSIDVHPSDSLSPRKGDYGWALYQTNAITMDARNSSTGCLHFSASVSNREGVMVGGATRAVCR